MSCPVILCLFVQQGIAQLRTKIQQVQATSSPESSHWALLKCWIPPSEFVSFIVIAWTRTVHVKLMVHVRSDK